MREFEYEVSPVADGYPTVTLGDVERAVSDVSYVRPRTSSGSLGTVTICYLVMDNGHQIIGQSSCVVPEKYNQGLGEEFARKNAMEEVWKLLGYELRLKLNRDNK